jgi:hypothetical protein
MHGTETPAFRPLSRPADRFFHQYEGYISSHDHRRADDAELAALARRIRDAPGHGVERAGRQRRS